MCTMILRYGDVSDQAAACIEIISDFSRDVQEARPVENELVRVMERDNAVKLDGDSLEPDLRYLEPGSVDVTVQGAHRTVPMVAFVRHCAFQFKAEDILVTVVARKLPADLAGLVRLTDLEPLLAGMIGMKDRRDELAAWFEARRGEDGFSL